MHPRYKKLLCLKQSDYLEIWKVMDEVSLQPALAKCLHYSAPAALSHQFRMEEQVLSTFNIPWIPRLLDIERSSEQMILYESWMEGERLDQWLARHPTRKEKRKVFDQICSLIELVHQAGYLYLDLKPDNVLIQNAHACLIDFNACVLMGSMRAVLSNPDALPPEHAKSALDARADQIGLGRLHQRMFGHTLTGWICLQNSPDRRFASIAGLRRFNSLTRFPIALGFAAVLMVSVLLAAPAFERSFGPPKTGRQVVQLAKKDPVQAGAQLYALIEQGYVLNQADADELLDLMDLGASSGNGRLCSLLLDQIPKEFLEEHLVKKMHLKAACHRSFDEEELSRLYLEICCSDKASEELSILAMALTGQAVEDNTDLHLMRCADAIELWQAEDALLFIQSMMSLKTQNLDLSKPLQESLKTCAEGRKMLEIWQSLKDVQPSVPQTA